MRINTRVHHDVLIVAPKERLTIESEAQFTEAFRTLLDGRSRRFALDLGDVPYIDSVGLGGIVQAYTSVRRRGGDLKLLRPNRRIGRLLAITRLNTVLKAYDTEDEVVRSFDADCRGGGGASRDIRLGAAPLQV
jgi:anti-sigma B factor antagonist